MKLKYIFNCLFFSFSVLFISAQKFDNNVIANNNSASTFGIENTQTINYSLDYGLADLIKYSSAEQKSSLTKTASIKDTIVITNALRVFPKALANNNNLNIIQKNKVETIINLL